MKPPFYIIAFILILTASSAFAQVTFTDVTQEAGITNESLNSLAVAWGDYDNDGDPDLYVAHGTYGPDVPSGPNVFYRNDGDGTFTNATDEAGLGNVINAWAGWYAGFMDYDNDGYPDLYVDNYSIAPGCFFYHNNGDGTFADVTRETGIEIPGEGLGATFGDYDRDGDLDIYFTTYDVPNVFYENNGDGTFTNATDRSGLGNTLSGINVATGDYDNDGDLDIYLSNMGGFGMARPLEPTALYRNNGDGTFADVAQEAGVMEKRTSRAVVFFDYDNDADLDIYVAGWEPSNSLYRNNGDGTFTDVAQEAGVVLHNSEQLTVGDYDNDGYVDIFVMEWRRPGVLYHNNGDGTFTDVAREAGVQMYHGSGYTGGCAFADYDSDGDLDLYVAWQDAADALYRNNVSDHNWLRIKPVGTVSNRDGIGARVMVQAGELSMMREINNGNSRGQNELVAHFGLGVNTRADSIEVRWPSGQVDMFQNVPANQFIVVQEGLGMIGNRAVEPDGKITASWGGVKGDRYSFMLEQNFPNPFNPDTWLPYTLAHGTRVIIYVHDAAGHLVRTLNLGHKQPGYYTSKDRAAHWDGRNEAGEPVASGVYFYTLQAGSYRATRKLTIMR